MPYFLSTIIVLLLRLVANIRRNFEATSSRSTQVAFDIPAQNSLKLPDVPPSDCSLCVCGDNDCRQLNLAWAAGKWTRFALVVFTRLAVDWLAQRRCSDHSIAVFKAIIFEHEVSHLVNYMSLQWLLVYADSGMMNSVCLRCLYLIGCWYVRSFVAHRSFHRTNDFDQEWTISHNLTNHTNKNGHFWTQGIEKHLFLLLVTNIRGSWMTRSGSNSFLQGYLWGFD